MDHYTISRLVQILEALPPDESQKYVRRFLDELAGDDRWEDLLATPESERALLDLARQAHHQAGRSLSLDEFFDRHGDLVS